MNRSSSLLSTTPHLPFAGRLARRLPFFYGWVIVFCAFLSGFLFGATSFWGLPVFVDPMHEDTGWSHAAILGALSVRFIAGAVGSAMFGHMADRRNGTRLLLFFGVLTESACLVSLRWVQSPLQFIVLYGVVGGLAGTGMRLMQATLVPKWFVTRRGSAVSLATIGGSLSALVMVPVISLLIDALGWRDAWASLGAILACSMLPCVALIIRAPEDIGLRPDDGAAPSQGARRQVTAETERSFTLSEAMHTWQLWLLMLALFFGFYSLSAHTVLLVPYFKEIGFSSALTATALSIYGGVSVVSRFFWGFMSDRFTIRLAVASQGLLTAIAALALLAISGNLSLFVVAAFQGLLLGGFPILASLVWPEFFGRRHLGSIIGLTQLSSALANAGGPIIAGLIFDYAGSYEANIWLLAATWLTCAAVMLAVRPAHERVAVAVSAAGR